MIIPQFDQDIATVQAMHIQHVNGFHMSDNDKKDLKDAMQRLNDFTKEAAK